MSFYDWYADLPPSSPQTWGEQTDVPEAADWYNAGYIICCGANLPMTRTPGPLRSLMGAEGELALRWTTFREEFWVTFRCQTYWLLATRAAWRVLWHLPRTGRFEPTKTDRVVRDATAAGRLGLDTPRPVGVGFPLAPRGRAVR